MSRISERVSGNYSSKFTPKNKRKNSTGFKGVRKNGERYQSQITLQTGKHVFTKAIGNYDTPAEAYQARVEYIKGLL